MPGSRFRSRNSYDRRAPRREPYDTVLIVCEGQKTELHYFEGLKRTYRLSSANIVVEPMGRDPLSLVKFAINELEKDNSLDRAYCVFDRDGHATFGDAVRKANDHAQGKSGRLRLAVSVPCFEVWPWLHFEFNTAPIVGGGSKTPGDKALAQLVKVMPDYAKGDRGIFEKLEPKLGDAMRNAFKLGVHNTKAACDNPSTSVHKLVEYLIKLKR